MKRRFVKAINSISLATVLALAVPWSAFAAELNASEVEGTANEVTVEQGSTTTFNIQLAAGGTINCDIGKTAPPATVRVKTAYSISAGGIVSNDGTLGAAWLFSASTTQQGAACAIASPSPAYTQPATVSAAATTPVGNYTIALSAGAGTTTITNPTGKTPTLNDTTVTNVIVKVVAPAKQNTTLVVNPASGTYSGTATLSARLTAGSNNVIGKTVNFTLNGVNKGSATTDTSGVASLSGVSLAGINAGTYANSISASFAGDSGYNTSPTPTAATLTVNKATATILLNNLIYTYDGTAKAATATTNPAGLNVSLSHSQNGQLVAAPTNVGSYDVVATLSNTNYQAEEATGTLVISKAGATILLGNLGHTYDGTAKAATATTDPAGLNVSLRYSQNGQPVASPTNAGSYAVSATINESSYDGSKIDILVISKANQTISFEPLAAGTYGDAPVAAVASADSGLAVSFSADGNCLVSGSVIHITGAGSCTITASQVGNGNYNAAAPVQQSFSIAKAQATVVLNNLDHTYDGMAHGATASTSPAGLNVTITYPGGSGAPTNAGSYAVVATIDNANYEGSANDTLVIHKAGAIVTLHDLSHVYNGTAKAATTTTDPSGLNVSINYSQNGQAVAAPTNAGSYDVVATVDDANYEGSKNGTLEIAKANQSIDFAALSNKTYGDASFAVSASANSGLAVSFSADGNCSVSGDTVYITGAGSCTITASQVGNGNYNAAQDVVQSFSIAKAEATVTLSNLQFVYNGQAHPATASTNPSGLKVVLTYDGKSAAPVNAGGYAVVATIDDANYQGSATNTLTIDKAEATVTLGNLNHTYTGSAKQATVQTSPSGLDVVVTYDGEAAAPVNAGSYAVQAVVNAANYQGSAVGTLIINKANQAISFGALANKTYLDPDFTISATGGASGNAVTFAATGTCSISGSTIHITGAGSCTITASQAGNSNYNAAQDVAQSFSIAKAQATVTLSNLNYVFDGAPHGATVATSPAGLNVVVTYQGSSTVPSAVGSYAVKASVEDNNYTGSAQGTLTIAAWTTKGFYQPVDMTPAYASVVYNTIKGGNTVPLKFNVYQGSTERKDTAAVASLKYATTSCDAAATSDEVEAIATGGTSLRYDATAGQFIYNWQTPKGVGCYRVTVQIADGSSTITAYFKTR